MPSKPYMPFWIGDYISKTGHLSQGQHGAYVLLLMHYWNRGPLPSDDSQLFNIARARTRRIFKLIAQTAADMAKAVEVKA